MVYWPFSSSYWCKMAVRSLPFAWAKALMLRNTKSLVPYFLVLQKTLAYRDCFLLAHNFSQNRNTGKLWSQGKELAFLAPVGERRNWEHQLVSTESVKSISFKWSCKVFSEMKVLKAGLIKCLKVQVASILFLEEQVIFLISEMQRYPRKAFRKRCKFLWLFHFEVTFAVATDPVSSHF